MGMSKSYYSISTLQKRGATLAEFAITIAMMATLAVTAIPKMSSLTEDTKGSKSRENVDKILFASKKFYEETAKSEGRGRFPGQEKYNFKVGWYDNESKLLSDLNKFDSYTYNKGWRWKSVFGGWWKEAPRPEGSLITNDQIEDCEDCPSNLNGHLRFREMFGLYAGVRPVKAYKNIPNRLSNELSSNIDLIILRDVIEHIPINEELFFLQKIKQFAKPDTNFLITFPPFYSHFGLHQQVFCTSILRYIPYLSILPKSILKLILLIFKENKDTLNKLLEIKECRMTIGNFIKLYKNYQL